MSLKRICQLFDQFIEYKHISTASVGKHNFVKADAKKTGAYFLDPSSLGSFVLLLVLICQYQSVIKKAEL